MEGVRRLNAFTALLAALSGVLYTRPVLRITAPAPNAVVHAGQPIDVTLEVLGGPVKAIVANVVGSGSGLLGLESLPYRFSFTPPSTMPLGRTDAMAFEITAAGEFFADPVPVDLERSDAPIRITVNFAPSFELEVGHSLPLSVQATFSDGSLVHVGESTETTYMLGRWKRGFHRPNWNSERPCGWINHSRCSL